MSATGILTVAGSYFDFTDPERCEINIMSIAHALSHLCRFTGHTHTFYSVAQHSVLVSHIVPPADALAGLLHDAAEAYLGDVASPLKAMLPDYRHIEARVEAAVLQRFGLPAQLPASIKVADMVLLATERRDLMPNDQKPWLCLANVDPLAQRITAMRPEDAYRAFMRRFTELVTAGQSSLGNRRGVV